MHLKDIATIASGIYAKPSMTGEAIYLQATYFDAYGRLDATVKPDLKLNSRQQKHLLQDGDILFAAKGLKNFSVIYREVMGRAVASSVFFVIRIEKHSRVNPEFLAWCLNHPESQRYYKAYAKGSSIPSISKKVLEDLDLPIPPMHTQSQILRLQQLHNRERELIEKIDRFKNQVMQALMMRKAKENTSTHGK